MIVGKGNDQHSSRSFFASLAAVVVPLAFLFAL
jgi:hypothetical protein